MQSATVGCPQWSAKKRSLKRRKIFVALRRLALERGRFAEDEFKQFCDWAKEDGLICHHHESSLKDDRIRKIDRFIKDNEADWHLIQVKASIWSLVEFLIKNFRKLLDIDQKKHFDSLKSDPATLIQYLTDLELLNEELTFVIIDSRTYTREEGVACVQTVLSRFCRIVVAGA